MAVETFTPQVSVILAKNIRRTNGVSSRYAGIGGRIDLTPYLGENGGVDTTKSITDPMGAFQITLADRMHPGSLDSLYGVVEPMDHVEIRMAREPHKYGGKLPIIMRGFVTNVSHREVMDAGGKPQRVVVVSGNDYGKAFNNVQIFWLKEYVIGKNLLTQYKFYEAFGSKSGSGSGGFKYTPAEFVRKVSLVVNEHLANVWFSSIDAVAGQINVDATVTSGAVLDISVSASTGPLWNFMANNADLAWNELFIEDREDGTYLVYRAKPYMNPYTHAPILQFDHPAIIDGDVVLQDNDIVSLTVSRTDADVANFFWADVVLNNLLGNNNSIMAASTTEAAADDTIFDGDYENNSPNVYGDRIMRVVSRHGYTDMEHTGRKKEAEQKQADNSFRELAKKKRVALRDMNRDNVVLESGTIEFKGDERAKVGKYLGYNRNRRESNSGMIGANCYVTQVAHSFRPFRSYTTNVKFIRGDGYLARTSLESSPYAAEGRRGPYDE